PAEDVLGDRGVAPYLRAVGTVETEPIRASAVAPQPTCGRTFGPERPGQETVWTAQNAYGRWVPGRDAQGSTSCRRRGRADGVPAGRFGGVGPLAMAGPRGRR